MVLSSFQIGKPQETYFKHWMARRSQEQIRDISSLTGHPMAEEQHGCNNKGQITNMVITTSNTILVKEVGLCKVRLIRISKWTDNKTLKWIPQPELEVYLDSKQQCQLVMVDGMAKLNIPRKICLYKGADKVDIREVAMEAIHNNLSRKDFKFTWVILIPMSITLISYKLSRESTHQFSTPRWSATL